MIEIRPVLDRLAETERERDALLADNQDLTGDRDELTNKSLALKAELVSARQEIERIRELLVFRTNQLTAAQHATRWIVARDGGRSCERCEQEVRRGEAYELLFAVNEVRHIHCPDGERPAAGPDVIASHVRYLCETCGARYGIAYDDHPCGPLTSVTVTIARTPHFPATTTNTEGAPTA